MQSIALNSASGPRGSSNVAATLQAPKVDIVLTNYGQSPAFLKSYSIVITCDPIGDLPTQPDYSRIYFSRECVVEPNTIYPPIGDWANLTRVITDDEVTNLLDHRRHLIVYGIVSYGNIFDSSVI